MNWTKLLFVLIVVLLYVPMVFLGANVFFPEYTTGSGDSYYRGYEKCNFPKAIPSEEYETELTEDYQDCIDASQEDEKEWKEIKNAYNGNKFVFITLFNLIILLLALFVTLFNSSVIMGLFLGATVSTFSATMAYFETNSKLGFGVLVVIFFLALFFISKKKDSSMDWKTNK